MPFLLRLSILLFAAAFALNTSVILLTRNYSVPFLATEVILVFILALSVYGYLGIMNTIDGKT